MEAQQHSPFLQALISKGNVMNAVILRDMRSRFFNHGLGFLIVPLFPFVHLFALTLIYAVLGRSTPFGNDIKLFFAVSLMPTLVVMYVTRFMSLSLLTNKSMLTFPKVQILDIVFARALLEILGILMACLAIYFVLGLLGSNPAPADPAEAITVLFIITVLSIGVGLIVSIIVMLAEFFATLWALFMVIIYLISGFFFVPAYLPDEISYILSWNPVIHGTEWMRTAFYIGYPDQFLDKQYLVSWALGSIFAGLVLEKLLRKHLMSQ